MSNDIKNFGDMDLSNLTDEQLDSVKLLASAAMEHFDRMRSAAPDKDSRLASKEDGLMAFRLIGRTRREKEARTEAA